MITTDYKCSERECDQNFGSTHGIRAELNRQPASNEFACTGVLANEAFVKRSHIGGNFGGRILTIVNVHDMSDLRKNYSEAENIRPEELGYQFIGDMKILVYTSTELIKKRGEAIRNSPFFGMGVKDPDNHLYCSEHAQKNNYTCKCGGDLLPARSKAYKALEILSITSPNIFLQTMFPRHSDFNLYPDAIRQYHRL